MKEFGSAFSLDYSLKRGLIEERHPNLVSDIVYPACSACAVEQGMKGDTFTLEHNEPDFVWLTTNGTAPTRVAIYLPRGFTADDVREALLVTGHVRSSGDSLCMNSDAAHGELCALVEEMLGYFSAPGVPSDLLLTVIKVVNESEPTLATAMVPLLAYAWLDIVVRDDIADKARSASDIWQKRHVEVDCHATCERRINELIARLASVDRPASRMAPSISTRARRPSGDERVG